MTGVKAIMKKELRSYFCSPVAYILIGVFLLIMGFIFAKFVALYVQYNRAQHFGQASPVTLDKLAIYLYQNMASILLFMTPFITMRLFAEEKRQHTLELLQTAPIKGWELVVGKFLSAYALTLLMIGISFIYALFMILWGNPDMAIIGTTYLGMALALACYIALGTFISAMTSSQAIAAILTFLVLLFLMLLQSLAQGLTTKWGFIEWGPVLDYLAPMKHLESFTQGLVFVKDVVYFITFTTVVLFLTHRVVESNRWR